MSDVRARGEPSGSRANGYGAAAACLGVWLLAGTALSGLTSPGPPFSVIGLTDPASEREEGTREAFGGRPTAGPAPTGRYAETSEARRKALSSQALDINRADVLALQALPGVGPVLARRIVGHREIHGPFGKPEDLRQVSGIGAKRYARLQGLIGTAEAP